MKNIFDFATKELSQDAFLRWLFENFDCKDNASLKKASQQVLKKLCNINDEEIIDVKTYSQWQKIDIFAFVKTNKRNIALFVEDKVFSAEHNQLGKYNDIIVKSCKNKGWQLNALKCEEKDVIKIFYKTSCVFDDERNAVEQAGWKILDIFGVIALFESLYETDCILLQQYIDHIREIEKAWKQHEMPASSEKGLDLIKWRAYFEFEIKPRLELDEQIYDCTTGITAYSYACLCIGKKRDENVPYIELRSRDTSENGVTVRILCHGVDYGKFADKINRVENRLKDAPNKLFAGKFTHRKQAKLLGKAQSNGDDFITFIKKCVEDYRFAMNDW